MQIPLVASEILLKFEIPKNAFIEDAHGLGYDNEARHSRRGDGVKFELILLSIFLLATSLLSAQAPPKPRLFVGGMGGIATLSGDGSAVVTGSAASTSLFDPKNGGAGEVFAGIHLFEYVSLEADYGWNRNNAILVSTSSAPGATSFFRGPESITQNSFLGNVSVYFRKRNSRVRPYLSEGAGAVLIHSRLTGGAIIEGSPVLPPGASSHATIALRTLTGIDVRLRGPWYFRYSFGETITRNTLGNQVSPSLHRIPKNFQNLFGFYIQL